MLEHGNCINKELTEKHIDFANATAETIMGEFNPGQQREIIETVHNIIVRNYSNQIDNLYKELDNAKSRKDQFLGTNTPILGEKTPNLASLIN